MNESIDNNNKYTILAFYEFITIDDNVVVGSSNCNSTASTTTNCCCSTNDINDNYYNNNNEYDKDHHQQQQQQQNKDQNKDDDDDNDDKTKNKNLLKLRTEIEMILRSYNVRGAIILALEGINGTISYPTITTITNTENDNNDNNNDPVVQYLISKFTKLHLRRSYHNQHVFYRLRIKIKSEIVTMGEVILPSPTAPTATTTTTTTTCIEEDCTTKNTNTTTTTTTTGNSDDVNNNNNNNNGTGSSSSSSSCSSNNSSMTTTTLSGNSGIIIHPSTTSIGQYVSPGLEWDQLLDDPNCCVIDVRNTYEIQLGTFDNAINPFTQSFIDLPQWLQQHLQNKQKENNQPITKIAMFCTGGIRCEKSTTFCKQLLQQQQQQQQSSSTTTDTKFDIPQVYHLEGGILAYLDKYGSESDETNTTDNVCTTQGTESTTSTTTASTTTQSTNNEQSEGTQSLVPNNDGSTTSSTSATTTTTRRGRFRGECYVFDQRVAVTYGLKPSKQYTSCYVCRHPLNVQDRANEQYTIGISCPYCYNDTINRQRHIARQEQIERSSKKQHNTTTIISSSYDKSSFNKNSTGQYYNNEPKNGHEHQKEEFINDSTTTTTIPPLHLYDAKELKLARQRQQQQQYQSNMLKEQQQQQQ